MSAHDTEAQNGVRADFPVVTNDRTHFLWGVATSAFQSEGGYDGPGQPQTNWAAAEARGDVAKTGAAADFWNRYDEDFARCRELGLTAFRMGIEWSRAQPAWRDEARQAKGEVGQSGDHHSSAPPPFDYAALDHYAEMLAACQRHGLEPVVTLHHFVHPAWLGPDPWLDEKTPALFAAYVREAVAHVNERLDRPIHWFITVNEPNMLVLNSYFGYQFPAEAPSGVATMIAAYNGLLCAHIAAYNTIHDLYAERGWTAPQVALNNYCSDIYWNDKVILDLLCARERGVPRSEVGGYLPECARRFQRAFREAQLPLHRDAAFLFGAAAKWFLTRLGYRNFRAEAFAPTLQALYASPRARVLDYIGLDYYDPFAAHFFRLPVFQDHEFANRGLRSWLLASVTSKWWDWRVLPRGLHFFCAHYAQDFDRAVLIAENGMALRRRWDNETSHRRDRMTRSDFLRGHVREVQRIRKDGVPLIGYLHWSLFDNYEWGSYTPRFGLFAIDFKRGTEREAADHTGDRAAETYAELIREARVEVANVG